MIEQLATVSIWTRAALTLLLTLLLLVLSLIPGRAEPGDSVFVWAVAMTPTALQKLMHLLLYALLAFLWAWTLEALESVRVRFAVAAVLAASFGAAMELAQTYVPGRFGTLADVLLNGAGALLGLLLAWMVF
ncbi:VanZ family protein [Lentisalinibacter orientalis]|uniref:VanZ family protein n=1 Tax=Lentisalinibacter orientalis TaxID=2992241 RepID=UPI00386C8A27